MTENRTVFHPSSLGYLQVCPRFKNDETRDNSFAERGTKLHAMVASGEQNLSDLPVEDFEAVKSCQTYLRRLEHSKTVDFSITKEVRLEAILSRTASLQGTADVLVLEEPSKRSAKVIDWKFGLGAVSPAKENPQTMTYAYMVFEKYPSVAQVETTLVCPFQEDALVDSYTWDRADVPMMKQVLCSITDRVLDEAKGPVLNWSVCRYCGAKATCSQMCQVMTRKSELCTADVVLDLLSKRSLSPTVRSKWQQIAEWAGDWAKQVKRTNLEAVLTDGDDIDGYSVVRRKGSVKVENVESAVEKLASFGYDRNLILAACNLSIPSLTKGLENATPEQRGGGDKAEIREKIEALLQGYLREGEPVVYLKKSKAKSKKKVKEING